MSFVGKFEQVSEDGWKAFMEALGIPKLLQVAASISTQTMEVTEENGKWKTKTSTRLVWMELKFKLDQIYDECSPGGRPVCAVVIKEGQKLVSIQTGHRRPR